jgi:hypothetical protein
MFVLLLTMLSFQLPSDEEMSKSPIRVSQLSELHDQEVGAMAELSLDFAPSEKDFYACTPKSSIPFPPRFDELISQQIFTDEETHALMDCSPKDCKFNLLPQELIILDSLEDLGARKAALYRFYEERILGLKGIDPGRGALFIRSRDHGFEDCEGSELQKLLNERPIKGGEFRLQIVRYEKKMRPTARLNQRLFWKRNEVLCAAEALIFSDHYDVDWVQVWSLQKKDARHLLKVQLRNRIDLLTTWVRRLNKDKFRKRALQIAFQEISEVQACLRERLKVNTTPTPKEASKLISPVPVKKN